MEMAFSAQIIPLAAQESPPHPPAGGDLTFGADYPVRMLGLTLDLCFLRLGGLPSWQSFQSVV